MVIFGASPMARVFNLKVGKVLKITRTVEELEILER
jgi:DNA-directed RNA polymerase subunit H (RpoH/RPB5)